jgi:hypothetical protein
MPDLISCLFLTLAVKRILQGIADNALELINESTHFCLTKLEPKPITFLNLPAYAFKLLHKRRNFLENTLLLGFILWIQRTHFRQCGI